VGDDRSGRDQPRLRLVRGDAAPEEIAAIVAVLAAQAAGARGAGRAAGSAGPASAWADPSPGLRRTAAPPAAGAWRRSGWAPGVRTRADW
jgi:hypothetical protein